MREREVCLAGVRSLLLPVERSGNSNDSVSAQGVALYDSFSNVPEKQIGPTIRTLPDPSIREVQTALRSLREASLCVVEAAQEWRKAERWRIAAQNNVGGAAVPRPTMSADPGAAEGKHPSWTHLPRAGKQTTDFGECGMREVQQVCTLSGELPPFLWHQAGISDPALTFAKNGNFLARNVRGPKAQEKSTPDARISSGERTAAAAVGAVLPMSTSTTPSPDRKLSAIKGEDDISCPSAERATPDDVSITEDVNIDVHSRRLTLTMGAFEGVNYLARMASDTDFVGASGSVLVDFCPPDTNLRRNPFLLRHNLDETLALYSRDSPSGGAGSGGNDGIGGEEGIDSIRSIAGARGTHDETSRITESKTLDTWRVKLAAAIIVHEDARERGHTDIIAASIVEADCNSGTIIDSARGSNAHASFNGGATGMLFEEDNIAHDAGTAARPGGSGGGGGSKGKKGEKGAPRVQDGGEQ